MPPFRRAVGRARPLRVGLVGLVLGGLVVIAEPHAASAAVPSTGISQTSTLAPSSLRPQSLWHRRTAKPQATSQVSSQASSPSIMVQLSTLSQVTTPAELTSWMGRLCPPGVKPSGQLVLQDTADRSGNLLTGMLDALVPYLPGGSDTPCFSRVYVGTVDPTWSGSGSTYVDAVQDATFRSAYTGLSHAVARSFVTRYPQVRPDWYVTYEANLNELYHPQVAAAYTSLLTAETASRAALNAGGRVMWSPAFWYPYAAYRTNVIGMAGLTTSLGRLFTSLNDSGHGIDDLNLQDFVAGSSCQPAWNRVTPADAVGWLDFASGLTQAPVVTMNVEQYSVDCSTGGIVNGLPEEVRAREDFYRSKRVTLGPAFELRYWLHNHA